MYYAIFSTTSNKNTPFVIAVCETVEAIEKIITKKLKKSLDEIKVFTCTCGQCKHNAEAVEKKDFDDIIEHRTDVPLLYQIDEDRKTFENIFGEVVASYELNKNESTTFLKNYQFAHIAYVCEVVGNITIFSTKNNNINMMDIFSYLYFI